MNRGLRCEYCQCNPSEFTILICDHVICHDCLWEQNKYASNGVNKIMCACGILSCFNKQTPANSELVGRSSVQVGKNSTKITANDSFLRSPQETNSRYIKTQLGTIDQSRFYEKDKPKVNKNKTLNTFELHSALSIDQSSSAQKLSQELTNQIKFLEIQFNKSIEETKKIFKKAIKGITDDFQHMVKNIKFFFFEQMVSTQEIDFINLSKVITKRYEKIINKQIKKMNIWLFQWMSGNKNEQETRETREPRLTIGIAHSKQKQNISINRVNSPNCRHFRDKERLLQAIQDMKDLKKLCKKGIYRKNDKEKIRLL